MQYLNEEFAQAWQNQDPYTLLHSMDGEVFRQVKNRKTFRFEFQGGSYFAKLHSGVGWLEIFKNLIAFKKPVLGAENEWRAIEKLESLGVATMQTVAYGSKGWNPARRNSFIVTKELTDTSSLEDFCKNWKVDRPGIKFKILIVNELAKIGRTLHGNGICHRDFYLCHFLLHHPSVDSSNAVKLFLIDLHRAMHASNLGSRWIIKDVAGLYFSAMDIGLTRRDLFRFIKQYDPLGLRNSLKNNMSFWNAVDRRAKAMYAKHSTTSDTQ